MTEEWAAKAKSSRDPSAYQPNALPLAKPAYMLFLMTVSFNYKQQKMGWNA